jgi:hypothetical protein
MSGPDDDAADDVSFVELTPGEEQAISALLASLPAEPMPPEVFARIEAALAAEPPLPGTGQDVLPSLDAARRRRARGSGPLLFRVAASVVALAAAVTLGVALVHSGNSSSGGASTAADASGTNGNALAGGVATRSTAASSAASGPAAGVRISRTGRTYSADNLTQDAADLVEGITVTSGSEATPPVAAPEASPSGETVVPSKSDATRAYSAEKVATTPSLLDACVREITDHDGRKALAVDVGTWAGHPALVIVLPPIAGTSDLSASVVKPTCGQVDDSSDILNVAFFPLP